jgi:hypothetical protein
MPALLLLILFHSRFAQCDMIDDFRWVGNAHSLISFRKTSVTFYIQLFYYFSNVFYTYAFEIQQLRADISSEHLVTRYVRVIVWCCHGFNGGFYLVNRSTVCFRFSRWFCVNRVNRHVVFSDLFVYCCCSCKSL